MTDSQASLPVPADGPQDTTDQQAATESQPQQGGSRRRKPRDPLLVYLSKALIATMALIICAFLLLTRYTVSIDPQYYSDIESSLPWAVWITDRGDASAGVGGFIAFETDERVTPYFPEGTRFVKEVVGAAGDQVTIKDGEVRINDNRVGTINDKAVRILERPVSDFDAEYTLGEGEYFLMGTADFSYDSRYWGPVKPNQVIGESYHLWPWFITTDLGAQ